MYSMPQLRRRVAHKAIEAALALGRVRPAPAGSRQQALVGTVALV